MVHFKFRAANNLSNKFYILSILFLIVLLYLYQSFFYNKTEVSKNIPAIAVIAEQPNLINSNSSSSISTVPIYKAPDPSPRSILMRDMHQTFNEDFNTFSRYLDSNGNITCDPNGQGVWQTVYYFCSRTSPANLEAEVYIDQNFIDFLYGPSNSSTVKSPFSLNNGVLSIEAKPSDSKILAAVGSWAKYTSGLITTQFSFSQMYGYFEVRAKLPKGKGLWPAFWLLPADKSWPPEIDIFEAFGAPNPIGEGGVTYIRNASHALIRDESCGEWHNVEVDITKDFHVYGVDWQPTHITYYFDDRPYSTCKPNSAANKPFFILINLAIGGEGSWPGMPDESNIWPVYMQIDYVRAYQRN
jgi:beta-glucanase (GH16 family)